MRLWHQKLIPYLDNKRLLAQHRECCALRGNGWGKKHSVVDYVFKYDLAHLYQYHLLVMNEMLRRSFKLDASWYDRLYRGKNLPKSTFLQTGTYVRKAFEIVYSEHDNRYLKECLLNLKAKSAVLVNNTKSIDQLLVELDMADD